MAGITAERIHQFLTELAIRYTDPAEIVLLGGSALCLLGSERPTLDIDYVGDDLRKSNLQLVIDQLSDELQVPIEPVPIGDFVPIPDGADKRHIGIGRFGRLEVFALDPYTIALSKLDRGFDSDLEDIRFLLRQNLVSITELERVVENALQNAVQFDLDIDSIQTHLSVVRAMLD
ncbi:hypothetical protein GC175_14090 [bacterium]|nr:hypothetical protein [bacterium]